MNKINQKELIEKIFLLIENGHNSFEEILKNLYGFYPNDLAEILKKLTKTGKIYINENSYLLVNKIQPPIAEDNFLKIKTQYEHIQKNAPQPHPLNFDWRFSFSSSRFIFDTIYGEHLLNSKNILFLGAPCAGVFFLLAQTYIQLNYNVTLLDKNTAFLKHIESALDKKINIIKFDLQYDLPRDIIKNKFDIIIMDPPWYCDYYKLFLSRAIHLIEPIGWIYTVLFPINTRSTAIFERSQIFNYFLTAGFSPISIINSALNYINPLFEKKAFNESNISVKNDWRAGDLLICKGLGHLKPLVVGNLVLDEFEWKEFKVNSTLIKIRINPLQDFYIKPQILPYSKKSKTIPTVSRRLPIRKFIDMWTSDNDGFLLTGGNLICDILKLYIEKCESAEIKSIISKKYQCSIETAESDTEYVLNFFKNNFGDF